MTTEEQTSEINNFLETVWWRKMPFAPLLAITQFTGIIGQLLIGLVLAILIGLLIDATSKTMLIIYIFTFAPWIYTNKFSSKTTIIVTRVIYGLFLTGAILHIMGYIN